MRPLQCPSDLRTSVERVLAGLSWHLCLLYLDDIIVHAPTLEEDIPRLRFVFDRLRAAGLKLSPKKCHVLPRDVEFLGHVVNGKGVATDPKKVEAVSNWPLQWTSGCQEAFDQLKSALTTAPVLAYPTRDDQCVLDTDASNTGTSAV